jgi:hypothetical protein
MGRRVQAPDPPRACRLLRARSRRVARLPPHSNGVGSLFHPRAVASNHSMICSGLFGCCPDSARRIRIPWIDSVMFNQEAPNGVYKTMIPSANIHNNSSGVLCPARLSKTNNILSGGSSWGNVTLSVSPSCQLFHKAWFSSGLTLPSSRGGGKSLRMASNCSLSQGWSTALGQLRTPFARTLPVAG